LRIELNSDLQGKPGGYAPMAAAGPRKRPAGDEEDSSDSSKKDPSKSRGKLMLGAMTMTMMMMTRKTFSYKN
jgi:hypothetical protein